MGPEPGARLGIWVEAGDLDGDGSADIIAGADQSPSDVSDPRRHAGKVYVIYGRSRGDFPALTDLARFSDGVSVVVGKELEDHLGTCLHARDLNQDGYDDLIASAAINRLSAMMAGKSQFESHGGASENLHRS